MDNKNFNKAPHFLLSKTEQEHKLQIVYMELRNILGMYECTDCYNYLPDLLYPVMARYTYRYRLKIILTND